MRALPPSRPWPRSPFKYPDAGAALLSLARAGKISERSWLISADALGGAQQFIREASADNASLPAASGVKTYHLEGSKQHFYSVHSLGACPTRRPINAWR